MELWDIYDIDRQRTGRTMERGDWSMQPGEYHLTVLALLKRPDGRYLITQRVMTKSWAPGCWEIPGGGVRAGEGSLEAVLREVREETGLTPRPEQGQRIFTYRRDNPEEGDNYFVDVWLFEMEIQDQDVHLQEEETMAYRFAAPSEIRELGEQDQFLHFHSLQSIF